MIKSKTTSLREAKEIEQQLISNGYHEVKKDEKSLASFEYKKDFHTSNPNSFEGENVCRLTWKE